MIGSRKTQWRDMTERIGRLTSAISPSGLRTASAQFDGLRIITPSRTAWPPIGALMDVPLPVMLSRLWVASTKPEAALVRGPRLDALARARVGSGAA